MRDPGGESKGIECFLCPNLRCFDGSGIAICSSEANIWIYLITCMHDLFCCDVFCLNVLPGDRSKGFVLPLLTLFVVLASIAWCNCSSGLQFQMLCLYYFAAERGRVVYAAAYDVKRLNEIIKMFSKLSTCDVKIVAHDADLVFATVCNVCSIL